MMIENAMTERWNIIDSAEMAVGIREVLNRVIQGKNPPRNYKSILDSGIEFLTEARDGGAIISGTSDAPSSFNGTLSPLCLTSDVYVGLHEGDNLEKGDDYRKIIQMLDRYTNALTEIKEKRLKLEEKREDLENIAEFFKYLFDMLLEQADPLTKFVPNF